MPTWFELLKLLRQGGLGNYTTTCCIKFQILFLLASLVSHLLPFTILQGLVID